MKYLKASDVLPAALLEELQTYVLGGVLYIPKPEGARQKWGERSGSRDLLRGRNEKIRLYYSGGTTIEQLSEQFYLSPETIRKIVYSRN